MSCNCRNAKRGRKCSCNNSCTFNKAIPAEQVTVVLPINKGDTGPQGPQGPVGPQGDELAPILLTDFIDS